MSLYLGIHQNDIPNESKETKFKVAFDADIVQVFIWNNHLWLLQSKMQSIYNTIIDGYKASKKNSRLFVIHSDYLMQLYADRESVKEKSLEDLKVLNTIAYNLQKFIKSQGQQTQIAINIHLPKGLHNSKERMVQVLKTLISTSANNILILLENVAKTEFSDYLLSYNKLKRYLKKIDSPLKIGITIDTAHIVGSGFSIDTLKELSPEIKNDVRLIHLNGNEKKFNSKQDKHVSVFSQNDTVFGGDKQKVQDFVNYVKKNFKKCYGFILERNDLTFDQNEFDELKKML